MQLFALFRKNTATAIYLLTGDYLSDPIFVRMFASRTTLSAFPQQQVQHKQERWTRIRDSVLISRSPIHRAYTPSAAQLLATQSAASSSASSSVSAAAAAAAASSTTSLSSTSTPTIAANGAPTTPSTEDTLYTFPDKYSWLVQVRRCANAAHTPIESFCGVCVTHSMRHDSVRW